MHKIVIEEKLVNNIPLNEYYDENSAGYKGLVFVQHGFTSNKERGTDFLGIKLARKGFFVVSIDAYKHGRRMKEPFISGKEYEKFFDIFTVVKRTARDIERLFKKEYANAYSTYDMVGISMGGMIAFYLTTISSSIANVVPVISAPDFFQMSLDTFSGELEKFQEYVYKKRRYIERISPAKHVDQMRFQNMFIMNTSRDEMVSYKIAEDFYKREQLPNTKFKLYDDTHTVNRDMQEDLIDFLLGE